MTGAAATSAGFSSAPAERRGIIGHVVLLCMHVYTMDYMYSYIYIYNYIYKSIYHYNIDIGKVIYQDTV